LNGVYVVKLSFEWFVMVVVSDSIFMLIFMALDGSGRLIVNGVSWFFLVVWLGKILAALMLEIVGFA
jgi:hypothetical protein